MKMFPDITQIPEIIKITTENGKTFSFSGAEKIEMDDVLLTFSGGKVKLKADTTPLAEISMFWSEMPYSTFFCSDHWERGYGDFEWRSYAPDRIMPWYFYAAKFEIFAGFGVKVRPDAFCYFKTNPSGITLVMDVRSGGRECILNGREITCCETVCAEFEPENGIFNNEKSFVALLTDGAVFPERPVYGFNNWYYAYGDSSAEEIIENTAHLARLTKGLENRPFMVIDDGWQEHRLDEDGFIGGSWRKGNARFPDMKKLAEDMSSYDVLPEIGRAHV